MSEANDLIKKLNRVQREWAIMAKALERISEKSAEWQKSTAKNEDREYPWWNLGDIANAALRKITTGTESDT